MQRLTNKQILLGITGGIAAYKCGELVRRLRDHGAEVRVAMTPAATEFITPLTMQALSGHPVHTDLVDVAAEAGMGHIELARWADLVVVAPASADFLARLAAGQADDLLAAVCLATAAPVAVAPAMNQMMWQDRRTQDNLARIAELGYPVWGPAEGAQACGETGPGRMLEPGDLLGHIAAMFESRVLDGRHVVITAGPTREKIDPVRYVSNYSSGKMGFALAEAAVAAGARVTLVSGPVNLDTPPRVQRVDVESAGEMLDAVMDVVRGADVFISAAAVADYRPREAAPQKLKKTGVSMVIELERNRDILAEVAAGPEAPFCVGFAAESTALEKHALEKLRTKKLDLIVANDITRPDTGFESDHNAVTILYPDGRQKPLGQATKFRIAQQIIELIAPELEDIPHA